MKYKAYWTSVAIAVGVVGGIASLPNVAYAAKTELSMGVAAEDVTTLDPHFATTTSDRTLASYVFGALVRFAPGSANPSTIEPDLAESWSPSADQLVWTFKLRPGVKWQSGFGDVNTDDVVFSLEKARDPKRSAFSGDYAAIQKVEAVDASTVRITLSKRVPSLLALLSNYSGGFIISKKAYEERGEDFKRRPVGFGPFQVASVQPGQSVTLTAYAEYFRGKPKLSKVTYRFLNNDAARDLAFESGELDVEQGNQDQRWLTRLEANPENRVDTIEPAELNVLHVNITKPPFNDIRVRQALAHAVNAAQIAKYRGDRVNRAVPSVIPSNNLGFNPDAGVLEYDPAKSKALLAEAGFPNGITVTMLASQLPGLESLAQLVQAQAAEGGITLTLQPVEHATWHQMIRKDLSPIVLYGAARFPIADYYLTQFYHSNSEIGKPTAVVNFSHCNVADEQIEAARTEVDPAKQIELWKEAQKLIVGNVCAIPLTENLGAWARKSKLNWGFEMKGSMPSAPLITEQTYFAD
ncbi:polyamine ABC transporter substrate-binding protein (plasmid) [Agrobacterium tumefaciens]|uniref:Polyamine ABC transporter substrate-binding protein n=2 Tax=Rhizobium/Agrobacterium group TaxID=227290 RepID=A0A2Z2PK71_AGRTU|nr:MULTISPECIES: ABC transporter substrate-binding protein [Rhizobium/Agrobacterium group]ASK41020.1 polyamine ABC transporter substrate-binding protein [Rhizobium rhizogenes]ASK41190.1 polyamine ABC transporter substrate-binding protein [Agrobacterium tumefaciens]ASK41825.1 polyamine ABC transporter substrate-binding protein [Agrobacterium tumefaciens]MDJ1637404.1 ABC transporter substrate-binding protein [Rhizobium rhizogenes]MDR5010976.1 ABC transporter substrate-binding protein [Agrobacter